MKVREIKAALKAAGIGFTVPYGDQPSSGFHYVAVQRGRGDEALDALKAAGADVMWVPACSHIYHDHLQVRR